MEGFDVLIISLWVLCKGFVSLFKGLGFVMKIFGIVCMSSKSGGRVGVFKECDEMFCI